jgi:malonate decarboxylase beta subunit
MSASSPPSRSLRTLAPRARVSALDDAGAPEWLDAWRPSPHLADRGLEAQDDDAVVTARVRLDDQPWLVAAQDERFLGGSVGAEHAKALRALFARATAERPAGVALLAASGGVRLHEANAAELELARALRALLDARAAGVRTAAIAVGDVFGGASVLACATDRLAALPGVRLGLSGPKVIESARGRSELDAQDAAAVASIYGADARVRAGFADAVAADAAVVRGWLPTVAAQALGAAPVGASRAASAATLDRAWGAAHVSDRLWRHPTAWIVAPFTGQPVDAASLRSLDAALLAHVGASEGPRTLLVLEDSPGHAVGRAAEEGFLSLDLARHAAALTLLRTRGIRIVGALLGTGHSAAFFANALQADRLCAAAGARVIAMDPAAIARVTGVDAARMIEHDPLMGQPVRHFAALGGVATTLEEATPARILAFAAR